MIDYAGFFITLDLISARSNLSNDCSLLAIVKFRSLSCCFPRGQWEPWDPPARTRSPGELGIKDPRAPPRTGRHGGFAEATHIFPWQEAVTVPTRLK